MGHILKRPGPMNPWAHGPRAQGPWAHGLMGPGPGAQGRAGANMGSVQWETLTKIGTQKKRPAGFPTKL